MHGLCLGEFDNKDTVQDLNRLLKTTSSGSQCRKKTILKFIYLMIHFFSI